MELSRTYSFNTAISPVDGESGKYDDDKHRAVIMPLRGKLMQTDGVCGMQIERFTMRVNYRDNIISIEDLDAAVAAAIEWAAGQPGFFPMRGDKTPKADMPMRSEREPNGYERVTVQFGTDVVYFKTTDDSDSWDSEAFRKDVHLLAFNLTRLDGVVGYELYASSASVKYDARITDYATVAQHVERVLQAASTDRDLGYFPNVRSGNAFLNLKFKKEVLTH